MLKKVSVFVSAIVIAVQIIFKRMGQLIQSAGHVAQQHLSGLRLQMQDTLLPLRPSLHQKLWIGVVCRIRKTAWRFFKLLPKSLNIFQQSLWRSTQILECTQLLGFKGVYKFSPIVFHQLQFQSRRIVQTFLIKQALTVKGMLTQHAT